MAVNQIWHSWCRLHGYSLWSCFLWFSQSITASIVVFSVWTAAIGSGRHLINTLTISSIQSHCITTRGWRDGLIMNAPGGGGGGRGRSTHFNSLLLDGWEPWGRQMSAHLSSRFEPFFSTLIWTVHFKWSPFDYSFLWVQIVVDRFSM